jgi:hypothetical protein
MYMYMQPFKGVFCWNVHNLLRRSFRVKVLPKRSDHLEVIIFSVLV